MDTITSVRENMAKSCKLLEITGLNFTFKMTT